MKKIHIIDQPTKNTRPWTGNWNFVFYNKKNWPLGSTGFEYSSKLQRSINSSFRYLKVASAWRWWWEGGRFNVILKSGPFPASFSLFSSFQCSWQLIFDIKFCQSLDSSHGPLELEATALPTEPQPLFLNVPFLSF